MPKAPPDLQEEVELFARETGRTGSLHFIPVGGWFARLSLKPNDPRLRLHQEGMAEETPSEDIWFHVPKRGELNEYEPLDIVQMGRSGIREFLDRGNTWSGRGEFSDHMEALRKANAANEDIDVKFRADLKEESRHEQRDKRRWRFKIPFLRVMIDLSKKDTGT